MPHDMVETPHGVDFSFLSFHARWLCTVAYILGDTIAMPKQAERAMF